LTYKDVIISSVFFQFALYTMVRLARGGFTVGELGLVAQGATILFLEAVNFAVAKVC
jgi:dolichol kinase